MNTRQDLLALSLSQNQIVQSFTTVAYCLLGGLHDSRVMLPSQKVCCYSLGVFLIFQMCGGVLGLFHRDPVSLQRTIVAPESTFFLNFLFGFCAHMYVILSLTEHHGASFK